MARNNPDRTIQLVHPLLVRTEERTLPSPKFPALIDKVVLNLLLQLPRLKMQTTWYIHASIRVITFFELFVTSSDRVEIKVTSFSFER